MVRVVVNADYSQFYLRGGEDGFQPADDFFVGETGLASHDGHGSVIFVAFRQNGAIPIDMEVLAGMPPTPSEEWQDVVEISFIAGSSSSLTGWDRGVHDLSLPLRPGESYRLRYAVADGDRARAHHDLGEDGPPPERYRIQIWPAPAATALIVRSDSGAGQYWNFQADAKAAFRRVQSLPPQDRTRALIDASLVDHPQTAKRIADGKEAFLLGAIAYAQQVYPAEMSSSAIEQLIRERAAAWAAGPLRG